VVTTDARDCDGRSSSFAEAVWRGGFRFHVWRNNGWAPYGWNNRPQFVIGLRWVAGEKSQRDYAAEAVNY
jgi:hypothetical protein